MGRHHVLDRIRDPAISTGGSAAGEYACANRCPDRGKRTTPTQSPERYVSAKSPTENHREGPESTKHVPSSNMQA